MRFSPRWSPTMRNYHYSYDQDVVLCKFSRTSAIHSFVQFFLPFSVSLPSLLILIEVSAAAFLPSGGKKIRLWTKKPWIFLQVVSIILMSNNGRILFPVQSGRTVSFSSVELF